MLLALRLVEVQQVRRLVGTLNVAAMKGDSDGGSVDS